MENAIELINISKKYSLTNDRPILLKNILLPQKKKEVWALRDVSFSIKKGQCVGIIGENGSGKSTLLKLISGITRPTKGSININGKIASLIELGAGFHPDLTGKENIYLNGTLLGLTRKEIDKKYQQIVEFADIGEYINQPVRTYSSGMAVRLGFSVGIHQNPDILLIDEVLAVGDEEFRRICIIKLKELLQENKTMIIVSHDLDLIRLLSNTIYLLKANNVINNLTKSQAIENYINSMSKILTNKNSQNKDKKEYEKEISSEVKLLDKNKNEKTIFKSGEKVIIKIKYKNNIKVKKVKIGIRFYSNYNEYLYGFTTNEIKFAKEGEIFFHIPNLNLLNGKYFITVAIADKFLIHNYDWKEQKLLLEIKNINQKSVFGSIDLFCRQGL